MSVSWILISGTVLLFDSFIKLYVPHGTAGPSSLACYWTGSHNLILYWALQIIWKVLGWSHVFLADFQHVVYAQHIFCKGMFQ